MKYFFLLILTLSSCSIERLRRADAASHRISGDREYSIYKSRTGKASLEVYYSQSDEKDINHAIVKAELTNFSDEDLVIDLKKSYQWSAWYRWQRFPGKTSETPLTIKKKETKNIEWTFLRREFGVMTIPFKVGSEDDEFKIKFEYCNTWGDCK